MVLEKTNIVKNKNITVKLAVDVLLIDQIFMITKCIMQELFIQP